MSNFLVFAGTSEGRRLIETLVERGQSVCASVATEYGKTLLPEQVKIFSERLDTEQMCTLLQTLHFDCVIDATHPYASLVTQNIKAACEQTKTPRLRLMRPEARAEGCVFVESAQQAAEVIAATTGRVLLTTGSKDLDVFTTIPDYQSRIYPRVLPTIESIQRCLALGYRTQNILAMQGPFTRETNSALIRQVGASMVVTKESGDPGGFAEKLCAAKDTGTVAVVIGRPAGDRGLSYQELINVLQTQYGLPSAPLFTSKIGAYFPLFVDLSDKRVVLFGGGSVATRRAVVLAPFCCGLTVVSPQISPEIEALGVQYVRRPYMQGDCAGYDYVLAATDNREVNHAIYEEAKALGIPVNVADAPEECSFYFPAIVQAGPLVIGVSASGTDHSLTRHVAQNLRDMIGRIVPQKGEQNA